MKFYSFLLLLACIFGQASLQEAHQFNGTYNGYYYDGYMVPMTNESLKLIFNGTFHIYHNETTETLVPFHFEVTPDNFSSQSDYITGFLNGEVFLPQNKTNATLSQVIPFIGNITIMNPMGSNVADYFGFITSTEGEFWGNFTGSIFGFKNKTRTQRARKLRGKPEPEPKPERPIKIDYVPSYPFNGSFASPSTYLPFSGRFYPRHDGAPVEGDYVDMNGTVYYYDNFTGSYIEFPVWGTGLLTYVNLTNVTVSMDLQLTTYIFNQSQSYEAYLIFIVGNDTIDFYGSVGEIEGNITGAVYHSKIPKSLKSEAHASFNGTLDLGYTEFPFEGDFYPNNTGEPVVGDLININGTGYYYDNTTGYSMKIPINGVGFLTYVNLTFFNISMSVYGNYWLFNTTHYFNSTLNFFLSSNGSETHIYFEGSFNGNGSIYGEVTSQPMKRMLKYHAPENYSISNSSNSTSVAFNGTLYTYVGRIPAHGNLYPRFEGLPVVGDLVDINATSFYNNETYYAFGTVNVTSISVYNGTYFFDMDGKITIFGLEDAQLFFTAVCGPDERNMFGSMLGPKLSANFTFQLLDEEKPAPVKEIKPSYFNSTLFMNYGNYSLFGDFVPRHEGAPVKGDLVDMNATAFVYDNSTNITLNANGTGELVDVSLDPLSISMRLNGTLLFGEFKDYYAYLDFWYDDTMEMIVFNGYYKGYQYGNLTGYVIPNNNTLVAIE